MNNENPRGMAADIRYGVLFHLAGLRAIITRVVTGYTHGSLQPQDDDYDHLVAELRIVAAQLDEFIDSKNRKYRADELRCARALISHKPQEDHHD